MGRSDPWREIVWKAKLDPVTKLVALAIAEHADALGECFPGRSRLARMTGLSEKTVSRSMAKLTDLIETSGIRARGRPGKNAYFRFVEKETESPIKKRLSVLQKGTFATKKRDSQSSHLYNPIEPSIEPAIGQPSAEEIRGEEESDCPKCGGLFCNGRITGRCAKERKQI